MGWVCLLFSYASAQLVGILDTTFANGGVGLISTQPTNIIGTDVVVQTNGKIIASFEMTQNANAESKLALWGFNPDGQLDSTFADNGALYHDLGLANSNIKTNSIALQADGKILVAGNYLVWGAVNKGIFIARLWPDGTLDSSFHWNGFLLQPFQNSTVLQTDLLVQPDGKILVLAYDASRDRESTVHLSRYHPDGQRDFGFGYNGVYQDDFFLITKFGTQVNTMALQPDGKIVMAAREGLELGPARVNYQFRIARLTAAGLLDSTFADSGHVAFDFSTNREEIKKLAIAPDGSIYAAGQSFSNIEGFVLKLEPDGQVDSTYGTMGLGGDPYPRQEINDMILQEDGRILLIGEYRPLGAGLADALVMRLLPNGKPDAEFGVLASATVYMPNKFVRGYAGALQPDGKIVTVGVGTDTAFFHDFFICRYVNDAPITSAITDMPQTTISFLTYPNPFDTDLKVIYELARSQTVSMSLLDMQGRRAATFFRQEFQPEGTYERSFELPYHLAQGPYWLRVTMDGQDRFFMLMKN